MSNEGPSAEGEEARRVAMERAAGPLPRTRTSHLSVEVAVAAAAARAVRFLKDLAVREIVACRDDNILDGDGDNGDEDDSVCSFEIWAARCCVGATNASTDSSDPATV